MVKIAVEYPFKDIRQALQNKGYQADMVEQEADASVYDVIVVRDQRALNASSIKGSLVETRGRSVNEIVKEVEERLQRAGKIPGNADAAKSSSGSGGGFISGVLAGAIVGAAAALLTTPKSGKELQGMVKEKIPSGNSDGDGAIGQVKEKAAELASQVKEKATETTSQVKEKATETTSQVKEKAAETTSQVKDKANEVKDKKSFGEQKEQ